MMKNKIYTKTGDKGTTSLFGGTRIPKNHIRLEAYGTIDELNSFLGLLSSSIDDKEIKQNIEKIQNELFCIGGILATEENKTPRSKITQQNIDWFENQIDKMQQELPPIGGFILPVGMQPVSLCHVCRTICRRAERNIYTLSTQVVLPDFLIIYINRLSDYLFVLARKINHDLNGNEILFKNNCQ
jgi:cob(I)alamin adenosyltransferase